MTTSTNVTPQLTPISQPIPPKRSINKYLVIFAVIFLLAAVSSLAYYLGTKNIRNNSDNNPSTPTPTEQSTQITPGTESTPLFSGKLTRLTQNLKLFKTTEDDRLNGIENDFVYYSAGKFLKGDLKDYTRIVAIRQPMGPGQPLTFTLATKDYQSFILDDPDQLTTKYPADDWQNPFGSLDKSKVTSVVTFDTEQPKTISLDKNFALYLQSLPVGNVATDKKDKNGNPIYDNPLLTDVSTSRKLTSPVTSLSFYSQPNKARQNLSQLTGDDKKQAELSSQYLFGTTEVTVVDSTGLPMIYTLTTPQSIQTYQTQKAKFDADWKTYQLQLDKYNKKEISDYPTSPMYVNLPHLGFLSSEIRAQGDDKLFHDYEAAFPAVCSMSMNTQVVNVTDNDLVKIGNWGDLPVYKLKDNKHPINDLEYQNKLGYYLHDSQSWDAMNKGVKMPTKDEYVSQNPLLFFKDSWNRWVALGEYDIKLVGGCGKPVVYLYPTKPTEVLVKFQAPVQFTTDIPKYADGWNVLANPNGQLTNLKPELTDCSQIDGTKKGSEYAKTACLTNSYPYLYWAGNITSTNYPTLEKGWVASRDSLGAFLNSKLLEMGLNKQEISDFTSYWLPELLSKNAPYYRISFLQTQELDTLFPMAVNPRPNTTFRIFLDYAALSEKPQSLPEPQTLNKLVRQGFTLVEWGGLKK